MFAIFKMVKEILNHSKICNKNTCLTEIDHLILMLIAMKYIRKDDVEIMHQLIQEAKELND